MVSRYYDICTSDVFSSSAVCLAWPRSLEAKVTVRCVVGEAFKSVIIKATLCSIWWSKLEFTQEHSTFDSITRQRQDKQGYWMPSPVFCANSTSTVEPGTEWISLYVPVCHTYDTVPTTVPGTPVYCKSNNTVPTFETKCELLACTVSRSVTRFNFLQNH